MPVGRSDVSLYNENDNLLGEAAFTDEMTKCQAFDLLDYLAQFSALSSHLQLVTLVLGIVVL